MDLLTLTILAIALCFDSFAVSISCGLGCCSWKWLKGIRFAVVLGGMQGLMIFIGWSLAIGFHTVIQQWDHWIAFTLLLILGVKMIYGALKHNPENDQIACDTMGFAKSVVLGVATSIDAIIAGVSVAFLSITIIDGSQMSNMIVGAAIVMIITMIACVCGLTLGRFCRNGFGGKIGGNAEIIGGIVLIMIGIKVLYEHLC